MPLIDTHLIVKELIDAGTSEKEAEVLVKRFAVREEISYLKNELATKADISKIESDVSELKSDIKAINTNLKWLMAIILVLVGILLKNMTW